MIAVKRGNRQQYTIETLKLAEQRRQAILDHIKAHPWCDYDALVAVVQSAWPDADANVVRGAVANMLAKREICSTGAERDRTYLALADTTVSAEAVRNEYLDRKKTLRDTKAATKPVRKKAPPAEPPTMKVIEPGRTRYSCGHTKPANESRGQGDMRERAHVSGCYIIF